MRVTLILSTDPIIDNLDNIKEYVMRDSESLNDWVDCPEESLPEKIACELLTIVENTLTNGVTNQCTFSEQYRDFKLVIQHFMVMLNSMKMKSQWVKRVKLLPETILLELEVEL